MIPPQIRLLDLVRSKDMKLDKVKCFVLDECDKMLEELDMRRDVQEVFRTTPHDKQVLMFSATLSEEIKPVVKKFMHNPLEVYVNQSSKLTLHGLQQYYVQLEEAQKNRKLVDLLDSHQPCGILSGASYRKTGPPSSIGRIEIEPSNVLQYMPHACQRQRSCQMSHIAYSIHRS